MSLLYCKLTREQNKNAEDWTGSLRIKTNECEYKDTDRRLKEQFINGINGDDTMTKIIEGMTAIKTQMKSAVNRYDHGPRDLRPESPESTYRGNKRK